MQTAPRSIPKIDKDINAIHRQMRHLEKIDTSSAASWQDAWEKHPDLHEQKRALYRERGAAQQIRDEKAHKIAMRERRIEQILPRDQATQEKIAAMMTGALNCERSS